MFFSIYLTISLFSIVRGALMTTNQIFNYTSTTTDLLEPEDLPDIYGSFPAYWKNVCTKKVEASTFRGWNKPWFINTMIELSIMEGNNYHGYGKIFGKGKCCISKGVYGEGSFTVQSLPEYARDSYRVYALCKPPKSLRETIRAWNPSKQISNQARIPIIQYQWAMRAIKGGAMMDQCELRTGCDKRDALTGSAYGFSFEAKTLWSLLDTENSLSQTHQGTQELFGCMKFIEERKQYACD